MQSLSMKKLLQSPVTWGAGGLIFATVVTLVLAYLYYFPPGQDKIVTFYSSDAAQVSLGDDVRMAGITVGSVTDISLESDRVRIRASVDNDAFVGGQSQVEVRMLTVVGGYYVNINSIGDTQLGDEPIAVERVTMPYSLIRALTDTTKITENVTTKPINQSLNEFQQSLTGTNVEALSAIVEAGNSIMSTIEAQRGQVTNILDVSDDYVRTLTSYRGEIAQLVRKLSIVISTLDLYGKGLLNIATGIGQVVTSVRPLAEFYDNHRVEFIEKVHQYLYKTRTFVERNGSTVRLLQRVQNLFERVLDAQNAPPALLATDLCIPVPGSSC
jgi:phospholipid/cholesterol/gamma-HCH transport system substrate-binding protein